MFEYVRVYFLVFVSVYVCGFARVGEYVGLVLRESVPSRMRACITRRVRLFMCAFLSVYVFEVVRKCVSSYLRVWTYLYSGAYVAICTCGHTCIQVRACVRACVSVYL